MARRGLRLDGSRALDVYQTSPLRYAEQKLGFTPWAGVQGAKGQRELFEDIGESARLQIAGLPAIQVFRVEAGHGVGKTIGAAALVNWFFDSFAPSVIYTTAPTDNQVRRLLWKDVKSLRAGKGLPGKVLPSDPEMILAPNHFAVGFTTSDNGGQGTSRFQGQHGEYLFFVLDEAEGVPAFVFQAVNAMMTGGRVVICLMLANPQTRTSAFHKKGLESGVANYRLSVLDHPNVVEGRDVVPGATNRRWAAEMIARHCDVGHEHDEDRHSFEVGFDVEKDGVILPAGTIFLPDAEFCFRVLGIAPANLADKVFVSTGRYEASLKRDVTGDPEVCQLGVDCARFGSDAGTIYKLHRAIGTRVRQVTKGDTMAYVEPIKDAAKKAAKEGAVFLSVRVDGTGGFGAGIIDSLKADDELIKIFTAPEGCDKEMAKRYGFVVHEVQFGGSANDETKYADIVTEMYAESSETLKGIRLQGVPNELMADLCERTFDWRNKEGRSVKKLDEKEIFRKKNKRSPDDGDGFVLAASPEFLFKSKRRALDLW